MHLPTSVPIDELPVRAHYLQFNSPLSFIHGRDRPPANKLSASSYTLSILLININTDNQLFEPFAAINVICGHLRYQL